MQSHTLLDSVPLLLCSASRPDNDKANIHIAVAIHRQGLALLRCSLRAVNLLRAVSCCASSGSESVDCPTLTSRLLQIGQSTKILTANQSRSIFTAIFTIIFTDIF